MKHIGFCGKGFNLIEAQNKREMKQSDNLLISVDFSPYEDDILIVAREKNQEIYGLKVFRNQEARDLYNKLIGKE